MRWYVIAGLAAVCLLLIAANGYQWQRGRARDAECAARAAAYEGALAQAEVARLQAVQAAERAAQQSSQEIQDAYQKGLRDAEAAADATVADLRSGTVKLRDEWRGCEARLGGAMSGVAAAAERAATAERRRQESAGAIVRAADECDAQVTALQARVNLDARLCGVAR